MNKYSRSKTHNYSAKQIYDLVMDIEKYNEFLPWVDKAEILSEEDNAIIAKLYVSFKGFPISYISEVIVEKNASIYKINAKAIEGPFQYLLTQWQIISLDTEKSRIDFNINFKFKSSVMEKLIGSIFAIASEKIFNAFISRADEIYGKKR